MGRPVGENGRVRLRRVLAGALVGAAVIATAAVPASGGTVAVPPVTAEDQARYGLDAVTEPEPLSRSELEHVVEMRRHLGVPRSRAFVRRLHADPAALGAMRSAMGLFAALLVIPDEVPWLVVRSEIDWQSGDGRRVAEGVLGPTFAGSFPSGRHYVIQCAGCDLAAARAAIAASDLPSPLRDHVQVRAVRYSLADLERYRLEVDALLASMDVRAGFGTMVMDDAVQIDVGVGHRKVTRLVRERFGRDGPVTVVRLAGPPRNPEPVDLSGARTQGRRSLVLAFGGAAEVTDRRDPCQLDYAVTARERSGGVTVAVRPVYREVHRAGGGICDLMLHGRLVTVRLDRPLGSRTLIDAATGDPVPVFDGATLLRPQWLPTGWDSRGEGAGGCWSPTSGACWSQIWGTPESEDASTCVAGSGYVELGQAPRTEGSDPIVPAAEVAVTAATVRGVPAEVLVDPRGNGSVTVQWTEGDRSFVLYGGSACAGAPAPTADVVTRIADSLR